MVDARAIGASGIGRYLRELLVRWVDDPSVRSLTLLGDPRELRAFVGEQRTGGTGHVRIVAHVGPMYSPRAQLSWLRAGAPLTPAHDAVFFPHWDAPVVAQPAQSVVTVHDLTSFRADLGFGRIRRRVGHGVFRRVTSHARLLISGSHAAADELRAAHPDTAGRVRVVVDGGGERFASAVADPGDTKGYLLWVGNVRPHKNPAAALDVLARLRARGFDGLRLRMVGRTSHGVDVRALARARGVGDAVDELGVVNDARLGALYAGCAALLFPSRGEGFGLPVVEAMAAGAPVVASSVSAVAEVVGDAAPTFAPDDVVGMADRAEALLVDPAARARAVARGRRRATAFSWDRAARETLSVLREAASTTGRRVTAVAFAASASLMAACDPCSGVISCRVSPRFGVSGQIVDGEVRGAAASPPGVGGVRVQVTRTEGVELATGSTTATTDGTGWWSVSTDARDVGEVVVDVTVSPPAPGLPYRVQGVRVVATRDRGRGAIVGRWVSRPRIALLGTIVERATGAPVSGAAITVVRRSGITVEPTPETRSPAYTNSLGYFLFEARPLGDGALVADIVVERPGRPPVTFERVAVPPTHEWAPPRPTAEFTFAIEDGRAGALRPGDARAAPPAPGAP